MISQEKQVVATQSYLTNLLAIFLSFIKISPLTFGGGVAMIPHIESEVVNKRTWLSKEEIPNVVAVAQSAPGSIAVNCAIYFGYSVSPYPLCRINKQNYYHPQQQHILSILSLFFPLYCW